MDIKNKKVAKAIFHAGVHIAYKVLNSAILGKDGILTMEIAVFNGTVCGIYLQAEGQGKIFEQMIPFSDILSIHFEGEIAPPIPTPKSKIKEIA